MDYKKIEELAEQEFVKLGGTIPVDPVRAARTYGLEIFVVEMEKMVSASPSGILAEHDGRWVVYINNSDSINRQRFTVAHELGHFLLHKGKQFVDEFSAGETFYRDGEDTHEEKEANYFAACFLMPEKLVEQVWQISKDPKDAANKFKVSEVSMTYRLRKLGLIAVEE